jgi:hypothetical protein
MDSNKFSKETERSDRGFLTMQQKKKSVKKVKLDKEFLRIAEKNLREDRELLERLAKI